MNLGYLVGTAIFAVSLSARCCPDRGQAVPSRALLDDDHRLDHGRNDPGRLYRPLARGRLCRRATLLFTLLLLLSLACGIARSAPSSVETVRSPKAELFYWVTIMFSQTLGTALGDWTADSAGLGYAGAALIFVVLLGDRAGSVSGTRISRTMLFWAAFVLTRPLGAVVGDFLDKPVDAGGLALSRYLASGVLLLFIAACILVFPQRAAQENH